MKKKGTGANGDSRKNLSFSILKNLKLDNKSAMLKMASKFQRVLEQATDSTLVEPNWEGIITCTDMIRSGEVPAKPSLQAIRKRLQHENPHVVSHTLLVLDACVKNCGNKVHSEVATREFMEDFKNLVTENKYDEVKNKSLEMLQCWATAFANKPEYKMVVDTHNLMKLAGFDFPSLKEADAMFMAQVAPEWADGPECYRCRSVFSVFTRKHHCRACGQIFCDKCSSREMAIPQFGIEKEVRVCETCYEKKVAEIKERYPALKKQLAAAIAGRKGGATTSDTDADRATKEKLLREKEEEDLALAIAISQSEAEAKEKEKQNNLYSMYNGIKPEVELGGYKGAAEPVTAPPADDAASDPLARYLNRDYWQQKKEGKLEEWATSSSVGALSATAPPPSEPSIAPSICSTLMGPDDNSLNADIAAMSLGGTSGLNSSVSDDAKAQADDTMKWCQSIKEQVSVMDNRIRSNLARGRPVFNDSAIQDLFTKLTELHSHVLSRMHTLDEQRGYYESLQDHLSNIGEARQAIDELREDHERKRQERLAEEQKLRQAQMQQTLEMMRMKKHAMLMEQREQALQRFQQQQQEMAMRRQQQAYYNPQMGYGAPPGQPQQSYYPGYQQGPQAPSQYPPVQQQPQQQPPSQPPAYSAYQHYQGAPAPVPQTAQAPIQHAQQYQQQYPGYYQQQGYQQPQGGYQQPQQHQAYQNGATTENGQYPQQHASDIKQEQQNHGYQQPVANGHNGYGNVEQSVASVHPQQPPMAEQPLISFD